MSNPECREDGPLNSTQVATSNLDPATQVQDGTPIDFASWWRDEGGAAAERVSRRSGDNYHDAQDRAQETALRIWLTLQRGTAQLNTESELLRYTCQAAHNNTIAARRRPRFRYETLVDKFDGDTIPEDDSPETTVIAQETHRFAVTALDAAFDKIDLQWATAFRVTHSGGEMSREEYSQLSGIPIATIGSRTSRAKTKLSQDAELRQAFDSLIEEG